MGFNKRCIAITKTGDNCVASAMKESEYCMVHNKSIVKAKYGSKPKRVLRWCVGNGIPAYEKGFERCYETTLPDKEYCRHHAPGAVRKPKKVKAA